MDTSERLIPLPSSSSSSQTPPSKCSPAVSSIFSRPLNAYGRSRAFGLYSSSLENTDLNGTVNGSRTPSEKPDLQLLAAKENCVKALKESEAAVNLSGSQSGSLLGSMDDTDSSSDPEDLEEEEEEEDPSDGSDASDSEKEYGLTRMLPRLTHSTCDTTKKSHGSTAGEGDSTTGQRDQHSVPMISAHTPSSFLFTPSEEQHSRRPTVNTNMIGQDWWFSLTPMNSPPVFSAKRFFSSSKSPPHSVLPKSPAQKSQHNARKLMSSSVDDSQDMMSVELQGDSVALKRLVSIKDQSTQDSIYSTSQSSTLSSLNQPYLSFPTNNKTAPFFNSHTNGFPQDAPLALVTQPRNHMNSPLAPRSQCPMPINLSSKSKTRPSFSPYKVPHGSVGQGCSQRNLNGQNMTNELKMEDSDESLVDDNDTEDTSSSTSDSSSSLGINSESSNDVKGSSETNSDGCRIYPKLDEMFLKSSPSLSADYSLLKTSCPPLDSFEVTLRQASSSSSSVPLPVQRKRVTDEKALRVPLDFGWQRVTRVRAVAGRLHGEVCYYAPCGKKLRLYPDVQKYLLRNGITEISRDNFSFSTKIHLGEFYLAREGREGLQWIPLSKEAIAPCIIAMDGRRQRKIQGQETFTGVQPPLHLQDASDSKLQRKLEAQEIARQATEMKIMKKLEKQARAQAAKEAKRQQAILAAEEKRKKKEQLKILKQQEKIRRIQQIRLEKEVRAQQILEAKRKRKEEIANAKILKAEKRSQEKEMRRQHAILQKNQERERRRQHLMLLKEAEARKKAEEKERLKQERKDEKLLNKERKLELRRLELQELKKPREDLCLADHKPLPELSRIPGLVLSGRTFSDCLMVLQFVHRFGKVLSLNALSLSELQAGLLNMTDGADKVQALLVDLVSTAVRDPSLSQTHKIKTALGELLSNVKIDSDSVSEALRIYMENHCEPDSSMSSLALSLRTKDFRAHRPSEKASVLSYLVNELCRCKAVVSEIEKNIDHMANLRKEKWIVEGALRKLRSTHAKKTGTKAAEGTQTCDNLAATKKRKEGYSEEDEDEDDESDEEEDEEAEEEEGKKSKKTEEEDDSIHSASAEELEKEIRRAATQQTELRQKLLESSYSLRSMMLGQDRYKRCYWLLPECGGVFVEAMETGLLSPDPEDVPLEKRHNTGHEMPLKQEELDREPKTASDPNISTHNNLSAPLNTIPDDSPLELTHFASPKYKSSSWTSASVPLYHDSSVFVNQWISHLPPPSNKTFVNTILDPFSSSSQTISAVTSSSAYKPNEDMHQQLAQSGTHQGGEILCNLSSEVTSSGLPFFAGSSGPPTRDPASQHARANAHTVPLQTCLPSVSETQPHMAPSDRPTTASSSPAEEVAPPQKHSGPLPVPEDVRNGWWWMSNVEELHHLSKALHCRGIRERALTKQIQKHMEYLARLYVCKDDAVIDVARLQKRVCCKEMVDHWCVQEQAMKWDISALKQVEVLESRVISANLHVKDWTPPKFPSQWEDLVYREHKSSLSPVQQPNSPLAIAVSRLAELERNIERRRENEDAPWRRLWHKALSDVHSSAQLVLCIQQLQNNIPWDRAIGKVQCQICHSGDDEESLLLCDGCDKGWHVYCHKPRITSIPDGDWFCPVCSSKTGAGFVVQQSVQSLRTQRHPSQTSGGGKRASEVKPNGKPSVSGELIKEEAASRSSSSPRKSIKEGKKRRADNGKHSSEAKCEPLVSKKAKVWRDGGTDELEMCQQLLNELEAHQDAWPFLKPVNIKSVPRYKKVVKNPMDLSTIREKFINKQYSSLESFTDDVNLVFDNCERFNEDNSEIGKAGHIMRRFFDKRWTELLN